MSFLRGVFGGGKDFAAWEDEALLDHLTEIVLFPFLFFYHGDVKAILAVARERAGNDPAAHAGLVPVANAAARMNDDYSFELKRFLRDRYDRRFSSQAPKTPQPS